MAAKFELIAKTQFGLEDVLAKELEALGAEQVQPLNRAVKYLADQPLLYKSNLLLRTALKILKPIATFQARDELNLYKRVREIDWSEYLDIDKTFAIDGNTHSEIFKHSKYVALKTKDAIVDQFREKQGMRPSVDTDNPDLRINVHIADRLCTISLDSSGTPLDKRAYRLASTEAPINEVLAAGIIRLTGWDPNTLFYDPMCGSGTFPIEAAMLKQNIPPGRLREFGFQKWNDYDAVRWNKIKETEEQKIKPGEGGIFASDMNPKALDFAAQNAKRAGVQVQFERTNFMNADKKTESGMLIMNPPYGERMDEDEDMIPLYQEIGTQMKHHFGGYEAWIISANLRALKFVGLKPSRKIKLFNGPLEVRLQKYELYKGSRKATKNV